MRLTFTDEQLRHMEEMAPGFGDAVQERTDARRAAPHVGLARDVKLPTQEDVEDRVVEVATELMAEWHTRYQRFATLIKRELAKVLTGVRSGTMPPRELKAACDGLWTLTVSIQMGELETIDQEVTRSLRSAYAAIGLAASACVRGREIGPSIEKAEGHLKAAAYHLDKYGLKP